MVLLAYNRFLTYKKKSKTDLNSMVGELYSINPELGLDATTPTALEQETYDYSLTAIRGGVRWKDRVSAV